MDLNIFWTDYVYNAAKVWMLIVLERETGYHLCDSGMRFYIFEK